MFPPTKPADVKQDSKEQFKTIGYHWVFSQNWIPLSFRFKWMQTGVLKYLFKIPSNWTNILWKQNNGNLDVLKQDSYYNLWLDYNILLSSMCPGNHFCIFRPHHVIFPTLLLVWTVAFKSGMIK